MIKKYLLNIVVFTFILTLILAVSGQAFEGGVLTWEDYQSGEFEHTYNVGGYTLEEGFDTYQEPPMLEEKVEVGELPPVEERLPNEPVVLPPNSEIGNYGGRFRMPTWTNDLHQTEMYRYNARSLLNVDHDFRITPHAAKSYEWNEDYTAITIELREGMRWSDGELFTVDDVQFHYEDYIKYTPDPESEVTIPSMWLDPVTNEPVELIRIDDYSFRFEWDTPNPTFIHNFTGTSVFGVATPKHYLKQWHPKYTGAEGDEAYEQFDNLVDRVDNTVDMDPGEMPGLGPWVIDERIEGQRNIYRRNPYYWKIDPDGNQLPYMDEFAKELVLDREMKVLQGTQGDFHMEFSAPEPGDLPLLHRKSEEGNYKVVIARAPTNQAVLVFNWYAEDENLRELFRTRDFRIAVSHAINREQVNELAWEGLWTPGRAFISPTNPNFDRFNIPDEWMEMYADYDPEKANQILDNLGLERGEDGIRRFPDGEKISITYTETNESVYVELFKEYFEAIGINLNVRMVDRSTWIDAFASTPPTHELVFVAGTTAPVNMVPEGPGELFGHSMFPAWGLGRDNSDHPQFDPHPDVKKLFEMWDKIAGNSDLEERDQLIRETIGLWAENIYTISVARNRPIVGIEHNNLRNAHTDEWLWENILNIQGQTRPEQWFLEE